MMDTQVSLLSEILSKIESLQASVDALSGKRKRTATPGYITLEQAAVIYGGTLRAVQNFLLRNADNPNGFQVRRLRGRVHEEDFLKLLESKRLKGRGETVRAALESIL